MLSSFYVLIRDTKNLTNVFAGEINQLPVTIGSNKSCDIQILKIHWRDLDTLVIAKQNSEILAYSLNHTTPLQAHKESNLVLQLDYEVEINYGHISFNISKYPINALASNNKTKVANKVDTVIEDFDDESTDYGNQKTRTKKIENLKSSSSPVPTSEAIREVKKADDQKISELIEKNKGFESLRKFQNLNLASQVQSDKRVLHGFVTWQGEIYDSKLFFEQEPISLGPDRDGLYLPFLSKPQVIGLLDKGKANISLPSQRTDAEMEDRKENIILTLDDLQQKGSYRKKGQHNMVKLVPNEVLEICFEHDISVYFFIDSPPEKIYEKAPRNTEELLKQALKKSGLYHGIFFVMAVLYSLNTHPPVIKDVPERIAKLIVVPPVEAIVEPPPPPPEEVPEPEIKKPEPPKNLAKKEPPPPEPKLLPVKKKIIQPPPKKIYVKQPVKRPVQMAEPTRTENVADNFVDVTESVGALAALGALNIPTAPTPNKGALKLNTNNINTNTTRPQDLIGAINMKGGQLPSSGTTGIQTKGRTFDPSKEIQLGGLAGSAGKAETKGVVVGRPELLTMSSQEGLSQKIVMEVVKKHVSEIQRCYEKALMTNSNISGRVEFEWFIKASGQVQWAKVKSSNIQNGGVLTSCVKDVFERMKFPVAKNGESTQPSIGLPFGTL